MHRDNDPKSPERHFPDVQDSLDVMPAPARARLRSLRAIAARLSLLESRYRVAQGMQFEALERGSPGAGGNRRAELVFRAALVRGRWPEEDSAARVARATGIPEKRLRRLVPLRELRR